MVKRSQHQREIADPRKRSKLHLELPFDMMVSEILTRHTVKTLTRFLCVSKSWCSLISQPHFQMEHRRRSQENPPLLLVAKSEKDKDTTLVRISTYTHGGYGGSLLREFSHRFVNSHLNHMVKFQSIQSCLGLVCFRNFVDGSLLVFNPTASTDEIVTLPQCQGLDQTFGFGYTTSRQEFKLVRIFFRNVEDDDCSCEVFTLGTSDGWREATSPPYNPAIETRSPLLREAIHFLPSTYYHPVIDDHYISAFHVDTEVYTLIPLPEFYFNYETRLLLENQCELAELGGSLCLTFDFSRTKNSMQLWLLKDYHGGKWAKEYTIDISSKPLFLSPLGITCDGCILLSIWPSLKVDEELCFYDTQKNCITKRLGTNCSALFFFESFTSLRCLRPPLQVVV